MNIMELMMVSSAQVAELLTVKECIPIMKQALANFSYGRSLTPLRQVTWLPDKTGLLGNMPAIDESVGRFGSKLLSVFHGNHKLKLASHQGIFVLFESQHGRPISIINAGEITAIRTAAVSAVATDLLARKEAESLAILGCGLQAIKHVEAMRLVRPIRTIRAWDLFPDASKNFADVITSQFGLEVEIHESTASCVKDADVICTLTPSSKPILLGEDIAEGTHINAVGSCSANCREVDTQAILRSQIFVDQKEATLNEAGDILIPISEGSITDDHIVGDLGQICNGNIQGRHTDTEITLFEALGLAIEDLAAANYIYDQALSTGKGTLINL